jgi:hypothetical protein
MGDCLPHRGYEYQTLWRNTITIRLQSPGANAQAPSAFALRRTGRLICPTGGRVMGLSSPLCKNIPLSPSGKSSLQARPVLSHRGALRNVTNAGRDAVDADALLTNGAEADGEVVWS